MTLGERIQTLRKAASLSQDQLAEALGVSRQSISKWELNDSIPDLPRLLKLGELFGVSMDELLLEKPPQASAQEAAETPQPRSALLQAAELNAASRLLTLGGIVTALGLFLLAAELLFLPILAQMHKELVNGQGYYVEYMRYAEMQPMPLIFLLSAILALFGLVLILLSLWQKHKALRR